MELSAIGEQVFAVESIRKKRVRKVRLPGGGSQDPYGVPSCPQHCPLRAGGEGESGAGVGGGQAAPRCRTRIPSPCLSFPRHLVERVE